MVRHELTPFFPAYAKMVSEGPDQTSDQTMIDSMSGVDVMFGVSGLFIR